MNKRRLLAWACFICSLTGLASARAEEAAEQGSFGQDVSFLKQHTAVVELSDEAGKAKVLVGPALQGRVFTSTAGGDAGDSFGWINRTLFASGKTGPHINAFGGEDRLWLGPEGGQFSIFFAPGDKFDMEHWQTPAALDTEPFDVVEQDKSHVSMRRSLTLTNYSKTRFDLRLDREVRLLTPEQARHHLGIQQSDGVKLVAFESINRLTNTSAEAWTKQTGLLSLWVLGMFNASPDAIVTIPFRKGAEAELGKAVDSGYFGQVPLDRLKVADGIVFFRADSEYRSKIGLSPRRALGVLGSWDSGKKLLTIVQFTQPAGRTDYVNSQWKLQDDPFSGDVANSYNDGPNALGSRLGHFYEMESSSPAAALGPGQSAEHVQRTMHLSGDEAQLDGVAHALLGIHLADIAGQLPSQSAK